MKGKSPDGKFKSKRPPRKFRKCRPGETAIYSSLRAKRAERLAKHAERKEDYKPNAARVSKHVTKYHKKHQRYGICDKPKFAISKDGKAIKVKVKADSKSKDDLKSEGTSSERPL